MKQPSTAAIREFVAIARASATWTSKIPGGKASGRHPREFSARVLEIGIAHELEHTSSMAVALEIAMDHLTEDLRYYDKLDAMEKRGKANVRLHSKVLGGRIVRS